MSDPSRRLRRHFTAASQRRFQRDGKRGGAYVARASGRHYCLDETSVLAESSDVYGVLQSSQVLLQVHGAKNACHYQASGWMMQRFGALRRPAANWRLHSWRHAGRGHVVQHGDRVCAGRR